MQMRSADGTVFAPQRDIVNMMPGIIQEVVYSLQQPWMGYYKETLEAGGITELDLVHGMERFQRAAECFIREGVGDNVAEAFQRAQFFELNPLVRMIIFERLGEVAIAAFFHALREATHKGAPSSVHDEYCKMLAAIRAYVEVRSGQPIEPVESARVTKHQLAVAEMEHRRIERQQTEMLAGAQRRIHELEQQLASSGDTDSAAAPAAG